MKTLAVKQLAGDEEGEELFATKIVPRSDLQVSRLYGKLLQLSIPLNGKSEFSTCSHSSWYGRQCWGRLNTSQGSKHVIFPESGKFIARGILNYVIFPVCERYDLFTERTTRIRHQCSRLIISVKSTLIVDPRLKSQCWE